MSWICPYCKCGNLFNGRMMFSSVFHGMFAAQFSCGLETQFVAWIPMHSYVLPPIHGKGPCIGLGLIVVIIPQHDGWPLE